MSSAALLYSMPMEASRLFWEGGGVVFTWRVDGAMLCMTSLLTHTISSSSDRILCASAVTSYITLHHPIKAKRLSGTRSLIKLSTLSKKRSRVLKGYKSRGDRIDFKLHPISQKQRMPLEECSPATERLTVNEKLSWAVTTQRG